MSTLPPLDRNGWLIVAGKAVRSFAFGLNAVALGLYLAALRLDATEIGAILSAALAGTVFVTLVIALRGDRIGRRRILAVGAALMTVSALVPLIGANPLLLLLLGLTGMVAVNASDSTGLQTVDQAVLPGTTPAQSRTAAYAVYGLTGTGAAALGGLAVGPLVAVGGAVGLEGAVRFAPCFVVYAIAGLVALLLALRMDRAAETPMPPTGRLGLGESRPAVARLTVLFSLDSLASGFVVQSFLAIWFATRFGFDPATLGVLFGAANVLSAASFPAAAWLAARIGLIRTMVFSHIPANLLLIAMAFSPAGWLAAVLYLARAALASMDVPARQSYLMAIVAPEQRTAAAGVTNLAKSVATSVGPALAGTFLVPLGLGVPLVACGLLKTTYDLTLFALFRSRPAPEEDQAPPQPA